MIPATQPAKRLPETTASAPLAAGETDPPAPPKKGRPKKPAADLRTSQFRIRVTPREKARIGHEAREAGLSASDYLRRRALDRPVEARVDGEARALLRRLGVNLNQLVRVAHRAGQVEHEDKLGALLAEVRAAVHEIGGEPLVAPREHPFPWHQG